MNDDGVLELNYALSHIALELAMHAWVSSSKSTYASLLSYSILAAGRTRDHHVVDTQIFVLEYHAHIPMKACLMDHLMLPHLPLHCANWTSRLS